jgi:predicted DNA-binding transcriptional regulator AlpA
MLPPDDIDRFINLPEAAERLGLHPVTARNMARAGTFPVPVVVIGKSRKVSLRRLVEYMATAA